MAAAAEEDGAAAAAVELDRKLSAFELAKRGGTGVLRELALISMQKDANLQDPRAYLSFSGVSALWVACHCGHVAVVKFLVRQETVKINEAEFNSGWTPAHAAAHQDHAAVIRALAAAGANLNLQDDARQTPLHVAAKFGRVAAQRALLIAKAKTDLRDEQKHTAEDIVRHRGKPAAAVNLFDFWNHDEGRMHVKKEYKQACAEEDATVREQNEKEALQRDRRRKAARRAFFARCTEGGGLPPADPPLAFVPHPRSRH